MIGGVGWYVVRVLCDGWYWSYLERVLCNGSDMERVLCDGRCVE